MLKIENVSHVYPDGTRALDDISLQLPVGVFGLLGPNGAGKSTLMRTLATLQVPGKGRILFDGIDVLAAPGAMRRRLGYLPQDFGVYPQVSTLAMLDHMAVLKGFADRVERREAVESMLARVNLWSVRKRRLSDLSGGMRQRFGVAQALIGAPSLVIVDEPTAGLDPEERHRLLELLAEFGEACVLILSTHLVEDVMDLCPNVAVMAAGRVLMHGTPASMLASISGRLWSRRIDRIEAVAWRQQADVISVRRREGSLLVHAIGERPPGQGFELANPSLEDAYLGVLAAGRSV